MSFQRDHIPPVNESSEARGDSEDSDYTKNIRSKENINQFIETLKDFTPKTPLDKRLLIGVLQREKRTENPDKPPAKPTPFEKFKTRKVVHLNSSDRLDDYTADQFNPKTSGRSFT